MGRFRTATVWLCATLLLAVSFVAGSVALLARERQVQRDIAARMDAVSELLELERALRAADE